MEIEDIEKTTVQLLSRSTWNEVADSKRGSSRSIVTVVEDVTSHFTQDRGSSSASEKLMKRIMKSQATSPIPNVIQKIVRKARKMFETSNAADIVPPSTDTQQASQQQSARTLSDPMEV